MSLSASVNSISSIPSPVYQCYSLEKVDMMRYQESFTAEHGIKLFADSLKEFLY